MKLETPKQPGSRLLSNPLDMLKKLRENAAETSMAKVLATAVQARNSHNAFIDVARSVVNPEGLFPRQDAPLLGVPFAVKANLHLRGFSANAGHLALQGSVSEIDSGVVGILRRAGAVPVGMTNMDELALGVTGKNESFGTVLNPIDHTRLAGGSSGGSAAAVALGVVPFALGTDTAGAVRIPASFCSIVGFRPTSGRYRTDGLIPLSRTRDTVGLLARDVRTVRAVDSVVTGLWSRSGAGSSPARTGRIRLAIPTMNELSPLDAEIEAATRHWCEALRAAGADVVEVDLDEVYRLDSAHGPILMSFEAVQGLGRYLKLLGGPHRLLNVEKLAEYSTTPGVAALLQLALEGKPEEADYLHALAARQSIQDFYRALFARRGFDALLSPTTAILPPKITDESFLDPFSAELAAAVRYTGPGSFAGLPSVSLPGGYSSEGLPIGLMLEADAGQDRRLLEVAELVEATTGVKFRGNT